MSVVFGPQRQQLCFAKYTGMYLNTFVANIIIIIITLRSEQNEMYTAMPQCLDETHTNRDTSFITFYSNTTT